LGRLGGADNLGQPQAKTPIVPTAIVLALVLAGAGASILN